MPIQIDQSIDRHALKQLLVPVQDNDELITLRVEFIRATRANSQNPAIGDDVESAAANSRTRHQR